MQSNRYSNPVVIKLEISRHFFGKILKYQI